MENTLCKKTRRAVERLAFCLQAYEHISEIDEAVLLLMNKSLKSLKRRLNDAGLVEPVKASVINETCGLLNGLIKPEKRRTLRETTITIHND